MTYFVIGAIEKIKLNQINLTFKGAGGAVAAPPKIMVGEILD